MKIVICGSVNFTPKLKEVSDQLETMGHQTFLPYYSTKIINNEVDLDEYVQEKEKNGDVSLRNDAKEDLIKRYFKKIKESDAIIVVNIEKNGIENYIGGNTFLEMGFAYVLDKKLFLLNDVPILNYKDEIIAMKPIILNGNLKLISNHW